ncbi:hypothetical protein [Thioalkalivibrio sp. ALMg11]|uniref:hypothetical protein n=1 Tax=Thioalkalivibrio sp. ALMg11 TaxID=1158165 RepID=UPI0012DCD6CB|nr:hypothetical protein [Thioalkalivibrio sp. ALMg11]
MIKLNPNPWLQVQKRCTTESAEGTKRKNDRFTTKRTKTRRQKSFLWGARAADAPKPASRRP